jgi:hypothetical protein
LREIVAFEQQRFTGRFGKGKGKAIAEVQSGSGPSWLSTTMDNST